MSRMSRRGEAGGRRTGQIFRGRRAARSPDRRARPSSYGAEIVKFKNWQATPWGRNPTLVETLIFNSSARLRLEAGAHSRLRHPINDPKDFHEPYRPIRYFSSNLPRA